MQKVSSGKEFKTIPYRMIIQGNTTLTANIKNKLGNENSITLTLNIKKNPQITSINIDNDTLISGATTQVTVDFDNSIDTSTFTEEDINATNVDLTDFIWSNSNKTLTATLTPKPDIEDITNTIEIGVNWKDINGLSGSGYTSTNYKVITKYTEVKQVSFASHLVSSDPYHIGESVKISVIFSKAVEVTGTPYLNINLDSVSKKAKYISGNGTKILFFAYSIKNGDSANGISINADIKLDSNSNIKDKITLLNTNNTFEAIEKNTNHKVDTTKAGIDSISVTSNPAKGSYVKDEKINFKVTFSGGVTVTNAPTLSLVVGDKIVKAIYKDGSGTKIINFTYTVEDNSFDADGISISKNAILLAEGTIKSSNDSVLLYNAQVSNIKGQTVNSLTPYIKDITLSATKSGLNETAIVGDTLKASFTFNSNVTLEGTGISLKAKIGSKDISMAFFSQEANKLIFTYTIVENDSSISGFNLIKNSLILKSGTTLKSTTNGKNVTLKHLFKSNNTKIDGIKPTLVINAPKKVNKDFTITLSSSKELSSIDKSKISVSALFDVSEFKLAKDKKSATLKMTLKADTKSNEKNQDIKVIFEAAAFTDTSGLKSKKQEKTIKFDNNTTLSIANPIEDKIYTLKEMQNMNISGTTDAEAGQTVKVNDIFDVEVQADGTWSKKVNLLERSNIALKSKGLVTISSSSGIVWPDGKTKDDLIDGKKSNSDLFRINNALDKSLTFKFNEKYKNGKFTLTHKGHGSQTNLHQTLDGSLVIFKNGGTVVKKFIFNGKRVFWHAVTSTVNDIEKNIVFDEVQIVFKKSRPWFGEIEIFASPVTKAYISANVQDDVGNKASVNQTVNMDITVPTVSIELNTEKILANQELKATITFSEKLENFTLDDFSISNSGKEAILSNLGTLSNFTLAEDALSATIIFTPKEETKADNIKIVIGKEFTDFYNNKAKAITSSASFSIDTLIGKINNIFILPHVDDTIPFVTNEEINIRVAFEESVIVKGIPSIKILLHKADDTTVEAKATFKNAINTKVLNFIYKVQAGDLYSAMSIPKGDIDLNEGSIKLLSTNDANISYENVPENTNIKINSTITSISSISISSNPGADKTYTTGDKVEFKVEFTKAITITNTNAKLKFTLDETVKEASYKSGNDNTILFEYLIVSGDKDTNGISINSNAIAANSFGENIFLNNVAIASDENHKVSTTGSTIQHSYFETKPSIYYKAGDTITAILEFNENVVLTTSKLKPSLTLKLGDKLVKAQYKTIEDTKMYFSYIVQDKDTAKQGASIVKNSLNLNFAQLQNIVGLDVKLELNSLINAKNIIIDTLVPTLTIKIPKNQNKDFTVTIEASEEITIKDTNKFSINQGSINKIDLNENKKTITIKINAPTSYDGDISLKIETGAVEDKARNSNTLTTETSFFSTSKPTISITTPLNNTKHLVDDGVLITGVSNIEDDQKITAKVGELKVGDFVVKNGKFEAIIPRAYFSKKYRYVRAYFEKTNSWLQIVELAVLDPKGKKLELNKEINLFKKVDDDYVKAIELDDLYSAEGAINGIRGTYGSYGNGMAHMPSGEFYLDLDLFEKYSIASVSLDTGAGRKAEVLSLQVSNDQIHWDTIKSHKDYANNITNHDWLSPFMEDTKVKLYATNKYGSTSEEVIRDLIPAIKATAKISLDKTVVKFGEDINISITLSPNTDLNSFGKDDIIAPNGTLGTLQTDPNNDYKKYINFTPNININDATNVITLKNTWTNKAGFNASLTTSKNYEVATKPVTITITDDQDKVTNKEIKYTFKLSSPSSTFDIDDIQVSSNAIKSNFSGSGDSYSLTVTPPEDFEGDLILVIEADTVSDTNGIGNLYLEYIQKVNTKPMPKPTIDPIAALNDLNDDINIKGSGKIGAAILVEFNGIKKSTTVLSDGTWNLTLGVNSYFEDDTYDVKVIMSDEAGNSNFETTTFEIDTSGDESAQLFIDSKIMADNIINQFEQYSIEVSGKTKNIPNGTKLTLKIGTITKSTTVINNIWSVDNIDISSLADGNISIVAQLGTLNRSTNVFKDVSVIVPTFSTSKLLVKDDFIITLEFNKDIEGLDLVDLEIKNATILSLTKVNNKKYILTIGTNGIGTKTKTVSVSIKANSVGTKIGNKNLSSHIDVRVDKTAPTLKFTSHSKNQPIGRLLNLTIAGTSDEIGAKVTLKFENKNLGTSIVQNDGSWKKENIDLKITAPRKITNTWTNLLRIDGIPNNSDFVRVSGGIKSWYSILTDNSTSSAWGSYKETSEATTFRYDFKDIYNNGKFYIAFATTQVSRRPGQRVKFYLNDTLVYTSSVSGKEDPFSRWVNPSIKFNRVDFILDGGWARVTEFEVFGKSVDKINLSANVKDKVGNKTHKSITLSIANSPVIKKLTINDTNLKKDDNATMVVTFNNEVNTSTFTTEDITTPNATLGNFIWSNGNKTLTTTLTPNNNIKYDNTNKIAVGQNWKDILGQNGSGPFSSYASVNYKVDTKSPSLQNIAITSNAGTDKMYQLGDEIIITALFNENVTSTDAKIKINIGGVEKELDINSSNSNKLIFNYIVQNGDNDTNGISVVANSLSGDIKDTLNNSASALDLAFVILYDNINHKVDTTQPKITSISFTSTPNSDNTYSEDENITIDINISVPVAVLGTPTLGLQIDSTIKKAIYNSISDDKKTLTFIYTVVSGDYDGDGIQAVANALSLNDGAILDENNKELLLKYSGLDSTSKVDAKSLSAVITAPSTVNGDFDITATLNKDVNLTTTSGITVTNGSVSSVKSANNRDYNIKISPNTDFQGDLSITIGDTTEIVVVDHTPPILAITSHTNNQMITRNEADNLTLSGTSEAGAEVNLSIGTTSLGTTSVDNAGNWEKSNLNILINVANIDKNIVETYTGTKASLKGSGWADIRHIFDGDTTYNSSHVVDFGTGIGKSFTTIFKEATLLHHMRVYCGNSNGNRNYAKDVKWDFYDANDQIVKTITKTSYDKDWYYDLNLNGLSIKKIIATKLKDEYFSISELEIYRSNSTITVKATDEVGNEITKDINLTVVNHLKITDINITDTTLSAGETADVIFNFNIEINTFTFTAEDLTTPNATIDNFVWSNSNKTLTATLTPMNNIEYDNTNKIAVGQDWEDIHGISVNDNFTSPNYQVDTKLPSLQNIAITSDAGDDNTYTIGDTIRIEALFNENVTSTDAKIKINIGGVEKELDINSSNSNKLIFNYIVQNGDNDTNGISVVANSLSGDIKDTLNNSASALDLAFVILYDNINHKVDTTQPKITSISFTSTPNSDNTYSEDENITIDINISVPVAVLGTPTLGLQIDSTIKKAIYNSISDDKKTLTFIYTVVSGDYDGDGIQAVANALSLNDGAILDENNKELLLKYSGLDSTSKVDAKSLSAVITAPSTVNGDFDITATLNKDVNLTTTSGITVTNGSVSSVKSANNRDYNIKISPNTDFQGDLSITIGDTTEIVVVDHTPPILAITSHTNNQMITRNEADNLTLSGTSEAGAEVNLSIGTTSLGTTSVDNAGNWEKSNLNILINVANIDKNIVETYTGTKASLKGSGWADIRHIFDGDTTYNSSHVVDFGTGIGKSFTTIFKEATLLHHMRVYCGNSNGNRNYAKDVKWDFYDANDQIVKTITKTSYDKDWYYDLNLNGLSIKKIIATKLKDEYFSISELEIYRSNSTITVKATDEVGNEITKDINLTVVNGFTLLSDSVENDATLDSKYAYNSNSSASARLNISPHLRWGVVPSGTVSYAIIMDDISAGQGNGWIHWNVFNIPKNVTSFEEGWSSTHGNANSDGIQQNTAQGNGVPVNQYVGPWPPSDTHTYQIKIYALNIGILENNIGTQNTVSFESTHGTNILGSTTLTFTFTAPLSSER